MAVHEFTCPVKKNPIATHKLLDESDDFPDIRSRIGFTNTGGNWFISVKISANDGKAWAVYATLLEVMKHILYHDVCVADKFHTDTAPIEVVDAIFAIQEKYNRDIVGI